MVWLLLMLLVCFALAGCVAVYVGYTRRGEDVPHMPWLGDAIKRGIESLPTVDNELTRR